MFRIRLRRSHFYLNGSTTRAFSRDRCAPVAHTETQHVRQTISKEVFRLSSPIYIVLRETSQSQSREAGYGQRSARRSNYSTLNKTSCLSGSSSLHSTSRQRSFASEIMLSEPFQRFSVRKPTRNYILQHKTCFKIPQSLSVISYNHFQGNSAGIQIKPSS